ncbi:hypothetical protein AWB75_02631 [Caballeronia catudaia]|uniref:Uncharacterized protein n=1 Tax=Caballeronia catudaia TaxID=1777136 RepID=A0A158AUV7_9BURK|nr:hypothetical protein AWB75_02631 [Caballeronia catudaia]
MTIRTPGSFARQLRATSSRLPELNAHTTGERAAMNALAHVANPSPIISSPSALGSPPNWNEQPATAPPVLNRFVPSSAMNCRFTSSPAALLIGTIRVRLSWNSFKP